MANKDAVACTATISSLFGPGRTADISLQNVGSSNVFVHWDTAEVDKGLRLAPGESVNTSQLDPAWRAKSETGFTAICDTGESTSLLWSV